MSIRVEVGGEHAPVREVGLAGRGQVLLADRGLEVADEQLDRLGELVAEGGVLETIAFLRVPRIHDEFEGHLPEVALDAHAQPPKLVGRRLQNRLFDEPLSNLDAALRAQVRVDIRKQHEQLGATSIYVTHDQVEAMTLADLMFVLNKGQVEQFGTPREVYDAPCSRFVAGFLGSPAMNFLPAVAERSDTAATARLADGSALALDLRIFPGLTPGQPITVGVRPHDLSLETDDSEASGAAVREPALTLRAGLVELLGPELQIHAELASTPVTLCLETASGVRKGDALRLRPRALHVFDAGSGASLRA